MLKEYQMRILVTFAAFTLSPLGCRMVYDNPIESQEDVDDSDAINTATDTESETAFDTASETENAETDLECDQGWQIAGNTCVFPLAENQKRPTSIAADDTHIYWTVWGSRDTLSNYLNDGAVYRVSKMGGEIELLAADLIMPSSIRINEDHVYWANTNNNYGATTDAVMRVAKNGGTPDILADKLPQISGLEIIGQNVFFSLLITPDQLSSVIRTDIMTAPKDGSAPAVVFHEEPNEIAFTTDVDQQYLYWATENMMRLPLDKSTPAVDLGYAGTYLSEMTADKEALYYLDGFYIDAPLQKFSIVEPVGIVTTLAFSDESMGGIALYGDDVYWTMNNAGRIMRSPKTPGESTILVENQVSPVSITVDEDAVYWANGGNYAEAEENNGAVMKMMRP